MTNNKYKILLVEDESNIRNLVATMLETSGYQVILAETCSIAKSLYTSHLPDLIVLDLGLPDMDGINLLDYVTKPFGSAELLARVRTALRNNRYSAQEGRLPGGKFRLKDLVIDYDARQVFIKNQEIKLTQTEYNIVALLSEHCGKMMTYSAIIKAIWGSYEHEGSIKKLQVNMANIRKKFGAKPGEANYIINELGVGYRMNGEKE